MQYILYILQKTVHNNPTVFINRGSLWSLQHTSIQDNLLSQMGDKAVKQPSIYVIKCLCPIVMHLENDLPPTATHSVINLKTTTGKTVWDLIHFPAEMTPEGKEVDFHLQ